MDFHIAGLVIRLRDVDAVLGELRAVYDTFDERGEAFKSDERNPHLCAAGCSHCCKSGAVFAVTLAEAVSWHQEIRQLAADVQERARASAAALLEQQQAVFLQVAGSPDVPGERDEAVFSARVSQLNRASPPCPLLHADLCTTYANRPMLCRAYGFPVDAYAIESDSAMVFRSLCVLYEGMALSDYVRAKDLKARLTELSIRLGGRDYGRFTSLEAILSRAA